jgi:hypothetical protein
MARFNFGGGPGEWAPPLRDRHGRFISRYSAMTGDYGSNSYIVQRLGQFNETANRYTAQYGREVQPLYKSWMSRDPGGFSGGFGKIRIPESVRTGAGYVNRMAGYAPYAIGAINLAQGFANNPKTVSLTDSESFYGLDPHRTTLGIYSGVLAGPGQMLAGGLQKFTQQFTSDAFRGAAENYTGFGKFVGNKLMKPTAAKAGWAMAAADVTQGLYRSSSLTPSERWLGTSQVASSVGGGLIGYAAGALSAGALGARFGANPITGLAGFAIGTGSFMLSAGGIDNYYRSRMVNDPLFQAQVSNEQSARARQMVYSQGNMAKWQNPNDFRAALALPASLALDFGLQLPEIVNLPAQWAGITTSRMMQQNFQAMGKDAVGALGVGEGIFANMPFWARASTLYSYGDAYNEQAMAAMGGPEKFRSEWVRNLGISLNGIEGPNFKGSRVMAHAEAGLAYTAAANQDYGRWMKSQNELSIQRQVVQSQVADRAKLQSIEASYGKYTPQHNMIRYAGDARQGQYPAIDFINNTVGKVAKHFGASSKVAWNEISNMVGGLFGQSPQAQINRTYKNAIGHTSNAYANIQSAKTHLAKTPISLQQAQKAVQGYYGMTPSGKPTKGGLVYVNAGSGGGGGGGYSVYHAQMQARQAMFTRLQGYEADAGLEASRVVRAPQMPMRFDYHDMMGGLGSFDYDPKGYFDRLDSGYSRNLAGIQTQYDFNVSGARQEALETKMPYLKELSRIKSDKNYNSSPEMKNAAKGVQEKINSIESYLSHKIKSWDLQLSEVKKDIGMTRENDYFNKAQQIASQFKQGVFNEKIQSIRDKKDFTNRRIGDLNFKLQNGMYKSGLFAAESGIREGLSMRGQAAEYDYQESLAYIQREEDQLSQMRFAAYDPRIPEGQRKEILEQMNQMAPALKERRASAERMLKYEQGQATLSRSEVINLRAPIFQQLSSPYVKALMGGLQGKPVMPAVSNAFFGQMTQLANYGAGRWLAGMSQKLMPNGFQGLGLTSGVGVAAKEGTIASMLQHVAGGKFAYLGTQAGFMAGAGGMAAGMIGSQMLYPMLNENYNRSTGFMGSALGGIAGAAIGSMIAPGIGTVAGGAFLGSMAGGSLGLLGAGSGKFDSSIESRYYTRQPVSRMQRAMKSGAGGALTGALVGGIAAGLMTGGLGFFAGAAIGTVGGGLAGGGIGALFGGSSGKMGPLGRAAYQQNELLPFLQSTQMGIDPFSSGFKFSILSDRFLQAARGMQGHGSNGMAMKRAAMTNILGLMNSLQPFQANLEAPGGYKGLLFGASLQDQVMLSGQNPFTSDPFSQMFGFYRDMQSKLGEFGSDNGRLDLAKQAFSGYYGNMMTQLDRSISDGQRDLGFMQRGNSISALDRVLNLDIMNRNVSTFDRDTQIQIEGAMGTLQRRGNIPAIIQKLKDDRAFEKDVLLRKQDILQQSSSLEADQQGANYSDASRTIQEMLGSRDLLTQKFNELLPEIGSTTDLFVKLNQEIRTITESMERFNSAIR